MEDTGPSRSLSPGPPGTQGTRMAFNLPNLLTYSRILAVPAIVLCFSFPGDMARWAALAVFVIAAVTDWLDGYFARAWSQQSALGRMLDPIADKLLVSIVLLLLVGKETIAGPDIWAAVIILSREILVSGLREFLADLRVSIPVSRLAKWKTGVQLAALGLLIPGTAADTIVPGAGITGIIALWLAALFTVVTGYDYLKAGIIKLMKEG
ncbi:CDP-diacylglycerol--glycerol-3-phosphate 3-phosphatidyltransferase [hydrothermal vent metagenome]|uniref:CDP-diacylglycerol--glycerol-3-phosphate 3-phosphatidyltransferase n=1 Tax=hydrothermal vent metagenome TaxID=652676 RepID=A0A3B0TGC2_9ZZZZ